MDKGYFIEDETIINPCNNDYLKETVKRLQDLVKHPDKITSYPYILWAGGKRKCANFTTH